MWDGLGVDVGCGRGVFGGVAWGVGGVGGEGCGGCGDVSHAAEEFCGAALRAMLVAGFSDAVCAQGSCGVESAELAGDTYGEGGVWREGVAWGDFAQPADAVSGE